jgi:uncharacterized protein YdgA (DUF945 family)
MSLNLLPTTIANIPMNGAFNYDVLSHVIYYSDVAATGDFQLNFRGDSETPFASVVPVGNTLEVILFAKIGETSYSLTEITIDGSAPEQILGMKQIPMSWDANVLAQLSISITQTSSGVFMVF